MAEELRIALPPEVRREMDHMAAKTGLSPAKLAAVLLSSFVEGDGKVYIGNWPEGPGIRLLPDWPRFSSKVSKIKKDEMK